MPPYMKKHDATAIDDGWQITDGDGGVIAILQTETLADFLLAELIGDGGGRRDYPSDVPIGEDGEIDDIELVETDDGQTIPYALVKKAAKGEPYKMSLNKADAAFVKAAVNRGIDSRLQACFMPNRGDRYDWDGHKLNCVVSVDSLPVLVRRLYECDDEQSSDGAAALANVILDSLGFDESRRLRAEEKPAGARIDFGRDGLVVGDIRKAIVDLPDSAPAFPWWDADVPDDAPGVKICGVTVCKQYGDGSLGLGILVDHFYLDEEGT